MGERQFGLYVAFLASDSSFVFSFLFPLLLRFSLLLLFLLGLQPCLFWKRQPFWVSISRQPTRHYRLMLPILPMVSFHYATDVGNMV